MKLHRVQRAFGVTLCLAVFGCATMREDLVKTDINVLKTTERQDAKKSFLVVAMQKGNVFELHTADACSRRKVLAKEEIKHFENKNGSIAADVTWGILGALAAGGGTYTIVDSRNVAATSDAAATYNPIGEKTALGLGIGGVVLGAGLLTIPLVDGIRASKARDEHRLYSEDGPVVAEGETCAAAPALVAGVAIGADGILPPLDLKFGDSRPVAWAVALLVPNGLVSVDLAKVVPESVLQGAARPPRIQLLSGTILLAELDSAPVFEAMDDAMWASMADTSRSSCERPGSLDACERIKGYAALYPESKYTIAAKKLVVDAEPTFTSIRDDDAYAQANAPSCKVPEIEDACEALKAYLAAWPKGRHLVEGKATLGVGQVIVAKMIAKREAEERAEAARQRAEEARAEAQRRMEEAQAAARQRVEEAQEAARQRAEEAREAVRRQSRSGYWCVYSDLSRTCVCSPRTTGGTCWTDANNVGIGMGRGALTLIGECSPCHNNY